ncbi:BMP family lipoprotein [Petrocella sp. FN5]|uniref:BMP family lipoprotein n=1 Tax=Petrocella sp. FN5 TaxID=3032002 RepID=UPI0023DB22CA|nr:BMP family ABC transporter substrate-binding protein [Petrocella sp. FN5]MDF1618405.1 BMP family ABC transporter substrate-binding protein [Petrocella sp. FN5]
MFKKLLTIVLALTMILSLALVSGCAKDEPEVTTDPVTEAPEETPEETPEEEPAEPIDFTVGLVTDVGGIDDKSFNQGTWEGILEFANATGAQTKYLQSDSDADYIPNLSNFSDEELDIIIAPGFLFEAALTEVATNFPDQKYLIIDMVIGGKDNVASAVFAEEQGSFLVGVAAALKAQEAGKDTVGFIGGMDFDLIQRFEAGFEAGVEAVDPNMTVLVEYAGDFSNAPIGQTLAAKMYDQGAYVIFHAAGGTGNGLIKEARDRRTNGEDVWAIGVDKDQYEDGIYEGDMSAVLTSMMKRVDVAARDVAEMTYNGEFPGGGILVFDLTNQGVGIPESNPNLSDAIVEEVKAYESKVVAGEVEVPVVPNRLK